MKKHLITLSLLLTISLLSFGQIKESLRSSCVMSAGANAKFLKDFVVQLGNDAVQNDLRYKANIALWKNTKYRFSLCSADDSKGKLILNIKDDGNKLIQSSYDKKTGKTYPFIDFICQKSGMYQLNYDFTNGQQGSGVGVVSMVK
jgi:hypothetical protein